MKSVLLLVVLLSSALIGRAQVESLPRGKYETVVKGNGARWDKGDIVILDDSHYKVSSSNETGEYKLSVTAQRIFFTSGPLKSIFAKTAMNGKSPAIIIPVNENEQLGFKTATTDVWGYYRQ
jgi:hypothetical protein